MEPSEGGGWGMVMEPGEGGGRGMGASVLVCVM